MLRAERDISHAAHHRKQIRRPSDAGLEAKPCLRGGLASVDRHHAQTINYRPPVVGDGLAPPRSQAVDLQEIHAAF
jgi:hypothetical protein